MTTEAVESLGHDITAIDTRTAGMPSVTAGYLIAAPRPTLVECGPALSIANVVEGLRSVGLDAGDLAYLVVSHIHLDHAGGAGDLAEAFPHATVVVSEIGARHLSDPDRLNASSRRVYGDLMDRVYGECTPIPAERVRGVGDRERLELGGGRWLDLLYTPGHAKHHIAAFDSDSGALFVGDSVGVRMPGMTTIRPATPPPDFDLVLAQRTLERYRALEPQRVYLAHYGAVDPPMEALDEASQRLAEWFAVAEEAYAQPPESRAAGHDEIDHVTETLMRRFVDEIAADVDDPVAAERLQLLNGHRSNASGLVRYLKLRDEGRVTT